MPQRDYFAPARNAIADYPKAAKIERGVEQQELENQLAARRVRQGEMKNALAAAELRQEQRKTAAEEQEQMIQDLGPLAEKVMQSTDPEAEFQRAKAIFKQKYPDKAKQMADTLTPKATERMHAVYQQWKSQQEPVDVKYKETEEGIKAFPEKVKPGEKPQPKATGEKAPAGEDEYTIVDYVDKYGRQKSKRIRKGSYNEFMKNLERNDARPGTLSSKDKEKQAYLEQGIADNPTEATKLAEDLYEITKDKDGFPVLADKSSGTVVRRLSQEQAEKAKSIESEPTGGIEGAKDTEGEDKGKTETEPFITPKEARAGTGPGANVRSLINRTIGFLAPGSMVAEKTAESRQKLRQFNQQIKNAFLVSSRGAVFDQQNIEKFLPNPDTFWQDPDLAVEQLKSLRQMAELQIANKERQLASGDITAKQQRKFKNEIATMKKNLALMPSTGELEGQFSNMNFGEMRLDDFNEAVQKMNNAQFENLSQEQQENIEERLSNQSQQQNMTYPGTGAQ